MSLKATFGLIGASLAILAAKANLEGDDRVTLDETVDALKTAESDFDSAVMDDVREAVDGALAGGLSQFSERHSDLHGGHEARIKALEAGTPGGGAAEAPHPLADIAPVAGTAAAGVDQISTVQPIPGVHVDAAAGEAPEPTLGDKASEGGPVNTDIGGAATFLAPVAEVTDPATQGDTLAASETAGDIVPGAVTGPDDAGKVRNDQGRLADAPAGSMDAAFDGVVKSNTTGVVASTGTDNTPGAAEAAAAQQSAQDDGDEVEDDGSEPKPDETPAERKARLKAEKKAKSEAAKAEGDDFL